MRRGIIPATDTAVAGFGLGVLAACFLASLGIVRSPLGRVLVAIRENEERTRRLGYDTYACKWWECVVTISRSRA